MQQTWGRYVAVLGTHYWCGQSRAASATERLGRDLLKELGLMQRM